MNRDIALHFQKLDNLLVLV